MVAFLIYLLKSSFCLTLLYGFYKLLCASTTRFSLNRWVLVGGMLTCLLLPFVSLELEHEPLVRSPFILMEEWKQPVDVISASVPEWWKLLRRKPIIGVGLCCQWWFICQGVPSFFCNGL